MATLAGRRAAYRVSGLEVVSDDLRHVLSVRRAEGSGEVQIALREATESEYGSKVAEFTVPPRDVSVLALVFSGADASFSRSSVEAIPVQAFRAPEPPASDPLTDAARIRATMAEIELDHGRGLHDDRRVVTCQSCQNETAAAAPPAAFPDDLPL